MTSARYSRPNTNRMVGMRRIDTHQHVIPPFYRDALRRAGIDEAGGRALPDWDTESALAVMTSLSVSTAIMSVSTPGTTFLSSASEAAKLAAKLNDHTADVARNDPERFGFFATIPTPHEDASAEEAIRALDELKADGVVLLANADGTYLGEPGLEKLWQALDERSAVVFIHPAALPAPAVDDLPPFAADFLLDTSRAAYLLVRHGIVRRYPRIKFLLSHAGGFLPYAAHRFAISITGDTSRSILDSLDDFRTFYFDTALSSSPAALPSLLAFALPGHVTFGSDWPFAPSIASNYFASCLDDYPLTDEQREAINWGSAAALLGRPGATIPDPPHIGLAGRVRREALSVATKLMQPGG